MNDSVHSRGRIPLEPGIAVVGTRRPTEHAMHFAKALGSALVERGFSVWSGGATGIDTAAHLGALEAQGPTVAVLGGGLNRPFPRENAGLFERIVKEGGATISLVPDDTDAHSRYFLRRNAYLARASLALVLVECGFKSGARHAAGCARRLDRPVFAVPCAPWAVHTGTLLEIERDARVFVGTDAFFATLASLGIETPRSNLRPRKTLVGAARRPKQPDGTRYEGPAADLLALLVARTLHPDEICVALGLPPNAVAQLTFQLEVDGAVERTPEGLLTRREKG